MTQDRSHVRPQTKSQQIFLKINFIWNIFSSHKRMKLKPVTEGKLDSQSVVEIKHTLKQQLDQRKKSQAKLESISRGMKAKSQYAKTYGCSENNVRAEISSYKSCIKKKKKTRKI